MIIRKNVSIRTNPMRNSRMAIRTYLRRARLASVQIYWLTYRIEERILVRRKIMVDLNTGALADNRMNSVFEVRESNR